MQPPPGLATVTSALDDSSSVMLLIEAPPTATLHAVSSIISSVVAQATASSASNAPESIYDESPGDCQLLGSFALLVQAALGGLALMSLVFKRWRERPQRPIKVWFFDVSKQVFGSVLVHMANIFMSMLTSGRFSVQVDPSAGATPRSEDDYPPNPCSFYLLNLGIDTTLGIPILIVLLRIMTGLVRLTPLGQPTESVQSGNYGHPPNAWWWLKQSVIYFCGLFGMKICVLIIFIMMPWISKVGDWALGWTEGNEKLQIAFVMMIFPLIMNGLQYYIIDSFIKKQDADQESLDSDSTGQGPRRYDDSGDETSRVRLVDADSDSEPDEEAAKAPLRPQSKDSEYDPDVDGDDDRTIVGSSSSQRNAPGKLVPRELYPKE
ncbi:vacuolar membrane protein-domain-containing protein [Dactylonectria macrodidyma]|uniref:Vacuolar membrane protein-domain-containing protein n=1 Tax=Dactylonectria macrodidyma TaxID=307937 RepID=A0A9P9FNQ3_9HYPO|nr:vacuolar membrane protein-domain-containing protein [Dactylonectria macrodidyma]